jgi:hypothetical protein
MSDYDSDADTKVRQLARGEAAAFSQRACSDGPPLPRRTRPSRRA